MILVLLGTFKINFPRPLIAIEKAILSGTIHEDVIVQAGHTIYNSKAMTIRDFINEPELKKLYHSASLIITHGGVGSILKGLDMDKKIIAIPRLNKFNEHVDDHQLDIVNEFEQKNYLMAWHEQDDISRLITASGDFNPSKFKTGNKELENYLIDYIENLS